MRAPSNALCNKYCMCNGMALLFGTLSQGSMVLARGRTALPRSLKVLSMLQSLMFVEEMPLESHLQLLMPYLETAGELVEPSRRGCGEMKPGEIALK